MWGHELTRRLPRRIADRRDMLTAQGPQTDARPDPRHLRVDCEPRPALTDIGDGVGAARHAQTARTMHVVPLRFEPATPVEHLDAVVLTVGDIDPAGRVAADLVHDVELTRLRAGPAPGEQQLAVRAVFVHPRVAVAVAHVQIALR